MKPGKLDLPTIWRGCDWPRVVLKWKDTNGNPFNLTGWSPKAVTTSGYNLRATVTDSTNGVTQMFLTRTDTADFVIGVQSWDWIWETYVNGQQSYRYPPFLSGKVSIKEPITELHAPVPPFVPPGQPPPGPPNGPSPD